MIRRIIVSQHGLGLLESLLAVAMLGFVIAGVSAVYVNMHDQILMNEALREAEDLRSNVQAILNQPAFCDTALVPPPGGEWVWKGKTGVSVGQIQNTQTGTPQAIVTNGGRYGRVLRAQNLFVRAPLPYEGDQSSSTVIIKGITYPTVSAKVVMLTQPLHAQSSSVISRTADVILRLGAGQKIVGCANSSNQSGNPAALTCKPGAVTGPANCINSLYCRAIYYIAGFDNQGTPICKCTTSCFTGPQGAVGNAVGVTVPPVSGAPGLYQNGENVFQLFNLSPKDWPHTPPPPKITGGGGSPPKGGPSAR